MSYSLKDIAKDLISGKLSLTEEELQIERIKMCEACDHFSRGLRKCSLCGCMMDIKTRMLKAECPIHKW